MLGIIANGDLFAHDAVYHKECMTKYYTCHWSHLRKKDIEGKTSQSELEGIAFAETVGYVLKSESDGPFYITELAELYTTRLNLLGGIFPDRVQHTSLSGAHSVTNTVDEGSIKAGKKLYIACEAAVGKTAARELHQNPDQNVCNMVETAIHLREHNLDLRQRFDGEFAANVKKSVPPILLSFIDMILRGPSLARDSIPEADDRKSVALSIAQLLIHNGVKKAPAESSTNILQRKIER